MITARQMRAARLLLALDQRTLALRAGVSLPTVRRMEASVGLVRANAQSLTRVIAALEAAGIVLIGEGASSPGGGRGVRLAGGTPP
jgi:predicted transcriptional regulator